MSRATSEAIVSLLPRDGLFLKDGRGWFTNEAGRAGALEWPFAATVRGALRTCLGQRLEAERGTRLTADEWRELNITLGIDAVLPLCRLVGMPATAATRRWPAPRDAVSFTGETLVRPIRPASAGAIAATIPLNDDPLVVAIERLCHPTPGDVEGKPAAGPAWWSDDAFTAWLCGLPVETAAILSADRPTLRVQTHVTIDAGSGTSLDGGLFTSTVVEPLSRRIGGPTSEWAVAAIGSGFRAADLAGRRVRFGGDGRMATCEPVTEKVFAFPESLQKAFAAGPRGLRLVVVSPAGLTRGWLPGWLDVREGRIEGDLAGVGPVVLEAACVGRPVHVSGWDMAANRPKPTQRLVPAGSVYFLRRADGGAFTAADAATLWLRGFGEAPGPGEATGAVVPGVWNPS